MQKLDFYDVNRVVKFLPKVVKDLMIQDSSIVCGGGFIRCIITGEKINDVDLFFSGRSGENAVESALDIARNLSRKLNCDYVSSKNAVTVLHKLPIQIIHRWAFDNPTSLIYSFDFTIAQAVIYYNKQGKQFEGFCADSYYHDLAAKRLVYTMPIRNEDAGGSFLRLLKFYSRGYSAPLDSAAGTIARLVKNLKWQNLEDGANSLDEDKLQRVIQGLLIEVDPNAVVRPDGTFMAEEMKEKDENNEHQ